MSAEDNDTHRESQFLEAARKCGFIIHDRLDNVTKVNHPTPRQLDIFNEALAKLGVNAEDLYNKDKTTYELQKYSRSNTSISFALFCALPLHPLLLFRSFLQFIKVDGRVQSKLRYFQGHKGRLAVTVHNYD
ncbi:Cytochrome P450 monooxygenase aclL [Fusarium oxysporum f. sp. albedinis]|nr:Cytochrome P450 monooxygenase aclL [Fusarium oxysporum f. sp. albedinis]